MKGTLTYKQGGNYLPLSELTQIRLSIRTLQPLPGWRSIQYKLPILVVLLGIAKSFQIQDDQNSSWNFLHSKYQNIKIENGNISRKPDQKMKTLSTISINQYWLFHQPVLKKQFNRNNSVCNTPLQSGVYLISKIKVQMSTLI